MNVINNAPIQKTTYGSYTPKFFDFTNGSFRIDLYKSDSTKDETHESILCLGKNDISPVQTEHTYKSRCNCHCCFAGYAHTVDLCNERNKEK